MANMSLQRQRSDVSWAHVASEHINVKRVNEEWPQPPHETLECRQTLPNSPVSSFYLPSLLITPAPFFTPSSFVNGSCQEIPRQRTSPPSHPTSLIRLKAMLILLLPPPDPLLHKLTSYSNHNIAVSLTLIACTQGEEMPRRCFLSSRIQVRYLKCSFERKSVCVDWIVLLCLKQYHLFRDCKLLRSI